MGFQLAANRDCSLDLQPPDEQFPESTQQIKPFQLKAVYLYQTYLLSGLLARKALLFQVAFLH